jgi:hypothetical protein
MQLKPAIIRAFPTQTYCSPTMQQLGLDGSSLQSDAWAQTCRVSVPWQPAPSADLQLFTHRDDSEVTMQFGA